MEISMKETSKVERLMARASTCGQMEKFTMANGAMESKRATECGEESLVIHSLENGRTQKQMDTVFISGRMEIDLKVSGEPDSKADRAQTYSQMEILLQVHTKVESQMATDNTSGNQKVSTSVNSKTESSMEKANGRSR